MHGAAPQVDALLREEAARKRASERGMNPLRYRRARPQPVLVLGQRPRDHLPRAAAGLRGARPRRAVPGARRALVCRAPRPAGPGFLPACILSRSRRPRIAGAARSPTADAVILGSYVPDGVAVGRFVQRAAARRHGLLRHRHAGDAGEAGARRRRIPRAPNSSRASTSICRSPAGRPCGGSSGNSARRMACALYCSVDAAAYRPLDGAACAGTSAISAPTAPTASRRWSGCCWSRRGARRICASSSPVRNIRTTSPGRRMSSGMEHLPPAQHPPSTPQPLHAERHPRRHGRAPAVSPSVRLFEAAACGTPVISDVWHGLTTLFAPGEEILLADDAEMLLDALLDCRKDARRDRPRAARACVSSPTTPPAIARRSSSRICARLDRSRPPMSRARVTIVS